MSYILGNYEDSLKAFKGEEFTFTFPNIILAADRSNATVGDLTGNGTQWEITLTNFPPGFELYQSETNKTTSGFLVVRDGQLDSVQAKWTPTGGASNFSQDGRLIRPRFWIVAIRINGRGGWAGFQFEFGISIETTDHKLHAEELTDDNSIGKHGEGREVGLRWYHPDHLDQALARRYKDPPRIVTHQIINVQDDLAKLNEVISIEPGDIWEVGTSSIDSGQTMNGMAMSISYEIGAGGRGLAYKRVSFIERFSTQSVILAVNGITLSVNGSELGLEI